MKISLCIITLAISYSSFTDLRAKEKLSHIHTTEEYVKVITVIEDLHKDGSRIYMVSDLAKLKLEWGKMRPSIVVVGQNNVDLFKISDEGELIRHSYNREIARWGGKWDSWSINYSYKFESKELDLSSRVTLSPEDSKIDDLYYNYLQR